MAQYSRRPLSRKLFEAPVDIRLVSSLTNEDEDRFAALVMNAMSELLGKTSAAYAVRIVTAAGKILQHSRPEPAAGKAIAVRSSRSAMDTRR
jgi:hypothetical protein